MTGPKDMAALRLELAETRQSLSRVKARLREAEERAALSQKSAQEAWSFTKYTLRPIRRERRSERQEETKGD